jgi:hypothetical protein
MGDHRLHTSAGLVRLPETEVTFAFDNMYVNDKLGLYISLGLNTPYKKTVGAFWTPYMQNGCFYQVRSSEALLQTRVS